MILGQTIFLQRQDTDQSLPLGRRAIWELPLSREDPVRTLAAKKISRKGLTWRKKKKKFCGVLAYIDTTVWKCELFRKDVKKNDVFRDRQVDG